MSYIPYIKPEIAFRNMVQSFYQEFGNKEGPLKVTANKAGRLLAKAGKHGSYSSIHWEEELNGWGIEDLNTMFRRSAWNLITSVVYRTTDIVMYPSKEVIDANRTYGGDRDKLRKEWLIAGIIIKPEGWYNDEMLFSSLAAGHSSTHVTFSNRAITLLNDGKHLRVDSKARYRAYVEERHRCRVREYKNYKRTMYGEFDHQPTYTIEEMKRSRERLEDYLEEI